MSATVAEAREYLAARGISESIAKAARLSVTGGRVRFPCFDPEGRETYFTARSLNGLTPKYLHASGRKPPLYASPGAWEAQRVAVVEGTIDALACTQAGVSAFALLGSSMSDQAAEILSGKDEVLLVFDADEAGQRAKAEAISKLAGRVRLLTVDIPEGCKDIAEVAERADDPGEAVAEVLFSARATYLPPKERGPVGRLIEVVSGDTLAEANTPAPDTLPLIGDRGVVLKGGSTLIVSFPKTGKTTLAQAAVAGWVDSGMRVLYLTEESRLVWEIRLFGRGWPGLDFVFCLGQDPEAVFETAFSGEYDILVVDTLRNVLDLEDETANSAVAHEVNRWIARARETDRTLIGLHHATKAGGDHGRGIAGGHALFACFDAALEIERVPGIDNRRKVTTTARLIAPPEFLYELTEDGSLKVLGELRSFEKEEVKKRALEILEEEGEWLNRKEIHAQLDEPRPGMEVLRDALTDLQVKGYLQRDPSGEKKGATYRYRFLTNLPTTALSIGGR